MIVSVNNINTSTIRKILTLGDLYNYETLMEIPCYFVIKCKFLPAIRPILSSDEDGYEDEEPERKPGYFVIKCKSNVLVRDRNLSRTMELIITWLKENIIDTCIPSNIKCKICFNYINMKAIYEIRNNRIILGRNGFGNLYSIWRPTTQL